MSESSPKPKKSIDVAMLRRLYIEFFLSKGHVQLPSASLIPYDVTGVLDETLLFNGAGMVQFKPYFLGVAEPKSRRVVTCQKCLRTGDIEEVGDDSHLTFFEMLGNFSFGDYFKVDAIKFSWEFLTDENWLHLDSQRLAFTVFEEDDESFQLWTDVLSQAGIDARERVFRLSEESNFWPAGSWSKGPPGPCGPNSEMFYWTPSDVPPPSHKGYSREDFLRDEEAGLWLEIWNDVFITYDWQGEPVNPAKPGSGWKKTGAPFLPFRSIDTGMGLERTAVVLGGKRSVYETDAFTSLLEAIDHFSLGMHSELSKEPGISVTGAMHDAPVSESERTRAKRIVADHLRAVIMALGEGIQFGPTGRGYVIRRLLRRAMRTALRYLDGNTEFFVFLADDFINSNQLSLAYGLKDSQHQIMAAFQQELNAFRFLLNTGESRLVAMLGSSGGVLPGEQAFYLYDTFGFPLELTQEVAAEQGWTVDLDGYELAAEEARAVSKSGSETKSAYAGMAQSKYDAAPPTTFVGYEKSHVEGAKVIESESVSGRTSVALDQTPFYATSGGQIADVGVLVSNGATWPVVDVFKRNSVFVHVIDGSADGPSVGAPIVAQIDEGRRRHIQRHHTATHLLHAALHEVIGKGANQAGSYVGDDRLRFDFTHPAALTKAELDQIERMVNQWVLDDDAVVIEADVPIDEARKKGAMALFGEKYGDKVRVVEIADYSLELCGGTHVRRTGEIGLFKILSESSAAGGVRRIEAVAGEKAYDWAIDIQARLSEAARLLKSNPNELAASIHKLQDAERQLKKQVDKLRDQGGSNQATTEKIGGLELAMEHIEEGNADDAKAAADRLAASAPNRVGIATAVLGESSIFFAVKVSPEAQKLGAHAGNIVKAMAQAAGGGGGGGPAFATAGGKNPKSLPAAIEAAKSQLSEA